MYCPPNGVGAPPPPPPPRPLGSKRKMSAALSLQVQVCVTMKSTTVMSPPRNWDSPTPLSPASVPIPPELKGGGAHSPAGEGLVESQFRRLEKSLALCLLCGSIPAYSDNVESGGRQMEQRWKKVLKTKNLKCVIFAYIFAQVRGCGIWAANLPGQVFQHDQQKQTRQEDGQNRTLISIFFFSFSHCCDSSQQVHYTFSVYIYQYSSFLICWVSPLSWSFFCSG
jgi:hypothetical protein